MHDDHHAHLCPLHAAPGSLSPLGWAAVVTLALWWLAEALPVLSRIVRSGWRLRSLERIARAGRDDIRFVRSDVPFAFAGGILNPSVYISSAPARRLSPSNLCAVAEHEQAHVRRRDGLRKLVASLLCATHLPRVRRALLEDLTLACEQACDAEAAAKLGDPTRVAEAIVAAARLSQGWVPASAVAWSSINSNVAPRVEALLTDTPEPGSAVRGWAPAVAGVVCVALAFAATTLHHRTEALVSLLVR